MPGKSKDSKLQYLTVSGAEISFIKPVGPVSETSPVFTLADIRNFAQEHGINPNDILIGKDFNYVVKRDERREILEKLIERFRKENTLRDAGVAAGKTLKRIRDLATQEELIKFYEEEMNVRNK